MHRHRPSSKFLTSWENAKEWIEYAVYTYWKIVVTIIIALVIGLFLARRM